MPNLNVPQTIRTGAAWCASAVVAVAVLPVVGEFFVKMAEENGLYDKPTERVGSAMSAISDLVSSPIFHWTAGILIGFAAGVWLDTWLRKFYHQNDSLISASEWRPEGLHVSWMTVNAKRLYTDYYIEIAVHGFNATGASISIGDATGNMRFRETIDTPAENGIEMPVPKVLHDRTPTKEIANLTQIFLVVEQRVPRDIVEQICRASCDRARRAGRQSSGASWS